LLHRGEVDGPFEPVSELGILLSEARILGDQGEPCRPTVVRVLDGSLDLVGMIVDGLSTSVGDLGREGDVAVSASQGCGVLPGIQPELLLGGAEVAGSGARWALAGSDTGDGSGIE
jgi:hypothetical protein